jgi:hypothetical protein
LTKLIIAALTLFALTAMFQLHVRTGGYSIKVAELTCESQMSSRLGHQGAQCTYVDDHGFFLLKTNQDGLTMECDYNAGFWGTSLPFNCKFYGGQ